MSTTHSITIRASRSVAALSYVVQACLVLGPLAIIERAFGVDRPAHDQLLVLPVGLLLGAIVALRLRHILPTGERLELQVGQNELVVRRRGNPDEIVERRDVGLIVLEDDSVQSVAAIRIYDPASGDVGRWETAWIAQRARRVKRALEKLGCPCAISSELYDGRFQAQTPGRPPLLQRPQSEVHE